MLNPHSRHTVTEALTLPARAGIGCSKERAIMVERQSWLGVSSTMVAGDRDNSDDAAERRAVLDGAPDYPRSLRVSTEGASRPAKGIRLSA